MVLLPVQYQVSKFSVSYSLSKPTNDLTLTHVFVCIIYSWWCGARWALCTLWKSSWCQVWTMWAHHYVQGVCWQSKEMPTLQGTGSMKTKALMLMWIVYVLCLENIKGAMRNLDSSPSHIGGQGWKGIILTFYCCCCFFCFVFFTMEKAILSVAFMYTSC